MNPDKPLFYQGKWWFISEDRQRFYTIKPHTLIAPGIEYLVFYPHLDMVYPRVP